MIAAWLVKCFQRKKILGSISSPRLGCVSPSGHRLRYKHAKFAESTRKSQEGRSMSVAHMRLHECNSCGCDSRARRDVGTLRLSGQGLPKVSRQVLADIAGHFQHVDARHWEHHLELSVGLNDAALVKLIFLDIHPDLLRDLRAGHGL